MTINSISPTLFVQALLNDDKSRDATITLLQFEMCGLVYRSMAIFEDQAQINRKVLARFSDVSEKQFSNLGVNRVPEFYKRRVCRKCKARDLKTIT